MASSNSLPKGIFNSAIFEHLQSKLDEDGQVREELRTIVQAMERQGIYQSTEFNFFIPDENAIDRNTMSILSRAHSIPQADRQL